MRFFCKHSCRDILRHKCQFCLAFCSVFIVVLSVVVVNTIIAKSPLIFLKLGEAQSGGYDGVFMNQELYSATTNFYSLSANNNHMLNYTHILELYDDEYNLSPRTQFQNVLASKSPKSSLTSEDERLDSSIKTFVGKLLAMDTEREREIGLTPKWPFSALNEGECLAPKSFGSTYEVELDDEIYF